MNRSARTLSLVLLGLSVALPPAHAQQTEGSDALEEVIVTARKRAQSIQDTPIAISAFDSVELRAAAFDNIVDVSRAAPGLFIETVNSTNARVDTAPRFRGVTFESTSPLQRTGSIFIDGILVSGGIQSIGVQDLERVEIIKGPQSALFGRNTFSGAINYVTKLPATEFGANLSMSLASRGEYRYSGGFEGPIAGDALRGRVTASFSSKEGHYNNAAVPGQTLGDEESMSIGGTLLWEPTDNFRMRLRGSIYEDNDGPAAVILTSGFADHNFGGFPLPGGGTTETAFQGDVRVPDAADIGLTTGRDTFTEAVGAAMADPRMPIFLDFDFDDLGGFGMIREGSRLALDTTLDFTDNVQLDILTGYNEDEFFVMTDFDSSAGHGFTTSGGRAVRDFSIEARLSGSAFDDRVDWSIGSNFIDIDVEGIGGFYDGILGFWFPGIFNDYFVTGAETTGIFGTLDVKLSDAFTLILEARYQEDEISEDAVNVGLAMPISPTTFNSFLPRVLLQYEPSEETLLYFNFSEGNLPGGFNQEIGELDAMQLAEFQGLVPGVGTSFDEETLTNYELGWKQSLLEGRMAFNLAAFYMERTDQIFSGFELVSDPTQINGVRTVAFTANGATTDIFGAELDGTWNATENLSFQGSVAYVNAEIASFPAGTNSGDFTAVFGPDADVEGQQAPRYPEWQWSLSATYEVPTSFAGGSSWYTRADVFHTGEFFDENTNLAVIPTGTDVNLRTGIRFDPVTLEFFVTNLFDEDAPIAGNNIADTSLAVRFGSGFFDFSRESVHIALRDKTQFGIRLELDF